MRHRPDFHRVRDGPQATVIFKNDVKLEQPVEVEGTAELGLSVDLDGAFDFDWLL